MSQDSEEEATYMSLPLPASITLNPDGTWSRNIIPPPAPTPFLGVNDSTCFTYAILAYGYGQTWAQGQNQLFPSGPGAKLPVSVPTVDDLWQEYFRYFLHYDGLKVLRFWLADYNWGTMATDLWRSNPVKFFEIFDKMTYWAGKAGVQLVPILGTSPPAPVTDTTFVQAVLRHDMNVLAWDLWNEPNVAITDPAALQRWAASYIQAVKPYSWKPVMVGTGNFVDFPDADWTSSHPYSADETMTFPIRTKPHFFGEFGYWVNDTYGYWPWFAANAPGGKCAMLLTSNGKGFYADYPYTGPLPAYP